jgi:hypothetical protein
MVEKWQMANLNPNHLILKGESFPVWISKRGLYFLGLSFRNTSRAIQREMSCILLGLEHKLVYMHHNKTALLKVRSNIYRLDTKG